ncbi:MAG: motility protein A [Lachnospiraceae bacterium]|nr:motility protein A [Lachnospiraceae bacterium]
MDLATLIGLIAGVFFIVFGIATGPEGWGSFKGFYDLPSILITFGGSFAGTLTCYSLKEYINGFKSFKLAIKSANFDISKTIEDIIQLSNVARKEGLLQLEEAANSLDDPFLKKGILLIVDGTDPDLVRGIMETELMCVEDRHGKVISFWETLASFGPAWGMIGTLIGLINMLGKLEDVSTVGPSMATALLTTLYGSVLANWIATPIANKLKGNNAVETKMKEVMIEGLLSIQAGENPRVIEEKLKSFLAPSQRNDVQEGGGAADGEE